MNKQISKKTLLLACAILLALLIAFAAVYHFTRDAMNVGKKHITLQIVHGDKRERVIEFDTDAEYLGTELLQMGVIAGEIGAYGLFIKTVDGETADESKQEWWCITKAGDMLMSGADTTVIADGERYELTLMHGY